MTSEFELIRRFFSRPSAKAVLGVGHDCALLQPPAGMQYAISTDMLVAGRHFVADSDPEKLGCKSLAVNLSDLAAAGADPAYALLAIALPAVDETWLEGFSRGFFSMAERFGVDLVGGDTTRGPLTISVTVIGHVPAGLALRRDGAQPGNDVWLSGQTGEAALALAHRAGRAQLPPEHLALCQARLDTPEPRVQLGRRLRGLASSAIDVSDGLAADLGHIAEASTLSLHIDVGALPRSAAVLACTDEGLALECLAAGGDDYELAFTAPAQRRRDIEALSRELGLALTRIGSAAAGPGEVILRDARGAPVVLPRAGFDHFA
ncbi:MAG: thiamine-phosphate kinase [Betaproteobacteria bacterium RIFCSPLOWO2_12_FULL_66_14]|nr:MAG: thiamine-phosphate kinase [Betaproteobacteria bacterium RIFCSPLOWO2_12_FULL_66_14]